MMDNKEEQLYISGFNGGYLIAKHEPELAAKLVATRNTENVYFQGLAEGKDQYDKEVREWSKSFSRSAPAKDERDLGHDR